MIREDARISIATDVAETVQRALSPRPAAPGYAVRTAQGPSTTQLPPWFIDRCRRAYLSIDFEPTDGARVLGVTSSLRGEGKTSIAIGIATAIAADTQRPTLLLECDLEKPSFNKYFGFQVGTGLIDWLEQTATLRIMRAGGLVNLYMIPSGQPREDPSRLYFQLSDGQLLKDLRPHFGNIVIDLPPVLDIAYSSLASQLSDRILLVARYGTTTIEDLEKTTFLLGQGAVGGIVLNGTEYKTPNWLRRLL